MREHKDDSSDVAHLDEDIIFPSKVFRRMRWMACCACRQRKGKFNCHVCSVSIF